VSGIVVDGGDAGRGAESLAVGNGGKQLRGGCRIGARVERGHRPAAVTAAAAARPFGFHFLDVGAVLQHDAEQIPGGRGAVYLAGESGLDHARQESRMVDMGVGEQKKVHPARLIDGGIQIAAFDGFVALVHAAIDGKAGSGGFDDMAGTGDGPRRAEKFDLHEASWSGPVSSRPRLANVRPRRQYTPLAGKAMQMPCTAWGHP